MRLYLASNCSPQERLLLFSHLLLSGSTAVVVERGFFFFFFLKLQHTASAQSGRFLIKVKFYQKKKMPAMLPPPCLFLAIPHWHRLRSNTHTKRPHRFYNLLPPPLPLSFTLGSLCSFLSVPLLCHLYLLLLSSMLLSSSHYTPPPQ